MFLDNLAVCSVCSLGWDSQIRGVKVLYHAIVYIITFNHAVLFYHTTCFFCLSYFLSTSLISEERH